MREPVELRNVYSTVSGYSTQELKVLWHRNSKKLSHLQKLQKYEIIKNNLIKKWNIGILKIIKHLNILKEIEKALHVHRLEELKVLVLHIIQSGSQT